MKALLFMYALTVVTLSAPELRAESDDEAETSDDHSSEPDPYASRHSGYRNPQGSILLSGFLGLATNGDSTSFAIGVGVGYAVLTGVVPGIRALLITGDGTGGEVATNVTLTPPIDFFLVPFVIGEVGRRWDPIGDGWIYGAGLGAYLGQPDSTVSLQLGYMFRRMQFDNAIAGVSSVDLSGPMIAISIRF